MAFKNIFLVIFSLLSFFQTSAFAAKKIALLTSMNIDEIYQTLSAEKKAQFVNELEGHPTYFAVLEAKLREGFPAPEFEVEIKHQVDQHQLSTFLQSPNYTALFWISHGGMCRGYSRALLSQGILDHLGFEITPVFQNIHPSLQFLGVVSCVSEQILEEVANSHRESHPGLKILTYPIPVDIKPTLLQALEEGRRYLLDLPIPLVEAKSISEESHFSLRIVRRCENESSSNGVFYPALRLESNLNEVVGTIPSCLEGEQVDVTVQVPRRLKQYPIAILSGDLMSSRQLSYDLGHLKVFSSELKQWETFGNDSPYGTNMRIFININ